MQEKITHEELVQALIKPGEKICEELTALQAHQLHMIIGISGEAGELLDAFKKHIIYRAPLDLANVVEELGDIEFYLEGLRQTLNLTRQEVLSRNISKLSKRYGRNGLKYTDEQAKNRADKHTDSVEQEKRHTPA